MKKIELTSRKLLRRILGGVSITAVAFIFQACYGPGPDMSYDVKLTGMVKSKTTNLPIQGIKVTVNDDGYNFGITDEGGQFDFYTSVQNYDYYNKDSTVLYTPDKLRIHFRDMDGIENGYYRDTTIIINPAHKDEVIIHVELEEKQ